MNNRWRLIALWALPIGLVLFFAFQVTRGGGPMQVANGPTVAPRNSAVARIAYGRFLNYLCC
jgi:cell division protease FtsH